MRNPVLVLASASPARLATLRRAGINPEVHAADIDEDEIRQSVPSASAARQVLELAKAKSRAVVREISAARIAACADSAANPDTDAARLARLTEAQSVLVVGCDSMLEFAGQILGKPHSPERALQRVRALSGASATLHTGHWVVLLDAGEPIRETGATGSTVVHFATFTPAEASAYVATGEPLEVAGSFTIDGLGGAFISGIEGDYHNVVGISLPLLRSLVTDLGVTWTDLWSLSNPSPTAQSQP